MRYLGKRAKVLSTRPRSAGKWSIAVDANGIPIGAAIDGENRNDLKLLEPTLDAIVANGLIDDIESLTRDRGYDPVVRACLARYGLTELEIQKRGTKPSNGTTPQDHSRVAMDRRSRQLVVVEPRSVPSWLTRPDSVASLNESSATSLAPSRVRRSVW